MNTRSAQCRGLATCLIDHLLRRVHADDLDTEVRGQKFGKPSGATTEVDDHRDRIAVDMFGEQVLPEPSRLRCEGTPFIVGRRDIGFVVIHRR
jgi:hypothetical protein